MKLSEKKQLELVLDKVPAPTENNQNKENGETLSGIVDRVTFSNPETGYHILKVDVGGGNLITVIAIQYKIFAGISMEFHGEWTSHKKYGVQFNAKQSIVQAPQTAGGLKVWLSSGEFKGIGPKTAERIVNALGLKGTLDYLNNPEMEAPIVKKVQTKKIKALKQSWQERQEINDIMQFLMGSGVSEVFAYKIYRHYGNSCVTRLMDDPYMLARDIDGIGFQKADTIALKMGFKKDSDKRLSAAIDFSLFDSKKDGHCYLTFEQILKEASKLTELSTEVLERRIVNMLKDKLDKTEIASINPDDKGQRFMNRSVFAKEKYCAEKIQVLLKSSTDTMDRSVIDSLLDSFQILETKKTKKKEDEIILSKEQRDAIYGILSNNISILTGGPGCGKTTALKALIFVVSKLGLSFELVSPTGRAAQKMSEVIGHGAKTIHRLLGLGYQKTQHDQMALIDADFIVVDESSMIDLNIASLLLRAIPPNGCRILFVGDKDQLPPVGRGNFFSDLINSKVIPSFILDEIFRQAAGSKIIMHAHDINNGNVPSIASPITNKKVLEKKVDCLFIDSGFRQNGDRQEDYPNWSSLRWGMDAVESIKRVISNTIPDFLNIEGNKSKPTVQILTPMKKGIIGTLELNRVFQEEHNPKKRGKHEITIGDVTLRVGDRVIHTRNNYELSVFNGDIGFIHSIDTEEEICKVTYTSFHSRAGNFSEGYRIVTYSNKTDLQQLELAYAITIHKSQGSEFDCIVMPIMTQHYAMLYRNLIYTGITRAKKLAILVGERKALAIAVNNAGYKKRQTSLIELIQ